MLLGIGMGAAHIFALRAAACHINPIGFVSHAIFGMAYGHRPALKDSPLAPYQFWIFVIASPITLIGLYRAVMNRQCADDHGLDRRPRRRGAVRRDDLDPTPAG